jgi:hypothetical protein
MTNKQIFIGSDNFKEMVTSSSVFVDKTLFIKQVIDSQEKAILITKPRRWGKTLNLDMLKTFFSNNKEEYHENKLIFTNTNIAQINNGSYVQQYFGKYPVILISFKDIIGSSFAEIKSKLAEIVSHLFLEHSYLYNNLINNHDIFAKYYANKFERIVNKDDTYDDLHNSINFLSELLYKTYNERVYILVDEYDKPFNHLLKNNQADAVLLDNVTRLISGILSKAGKSNKYLEKIILVGIFDNLLKEGESGFNNINVYGVLDEEFSTSFGFSEIEINYLIDKLDLNNTSVDLKQVIKNWYNGYTIPINNGANIQVYTPWAVARYLHAAVNGKYRAENYWSKTASDSLFRELLNSIADKNIETKFHHLSKGEEVVLKYDKDASLLKYKILHPLKSEASIAYLLLNSGYLTARALDRKYLFRVPNLEVQNELTKVIEEELDNVSEGEVKYKKSLLKLFYRLQENKLQQAIKFVIEDNNNALAELMGKTEFVCEDNYFNYNLLHVAALAGKREILQNIMPFCSNEFYPNLDKLDGLSIADFAFLSGKKQMQEVLKEYNLPTKLGLEAPNIIENLVCAPIGLMYMGYNVVITSVLTASIKVFAKFFTPREMSFREQLTIASITDAGLSIAKEVVKYVASTKFNLCGVYDKYNKVDISASFTSLKQFEKYILEHPNSYVSMSNNCDCNYNKVAEIDLPMSTYDEELTIKFSLYAFEGEF